MSTKIAQHAYEELRNRMESEKVARSKSEAREQGLARNTKPPNSRKDDSAHEQCDAGATSADTASDFEEDSDFDEDSEQQINEVSVALRPPLTEVIWLFGFCHLLRLD
jgi:hypothetical protein